MTEVVALGDSFTCGEGVGVRTPAHLTWVAQLTSRLHGGVLASYAAPGARVSDVRSRQLPQVGRAELITLLVGLNDVARTGFDPARVRTDLHEVVRRATATGATVLLCRLHDPCRILSLPPPLRRLVRGRVDQINAAVDELQVTPRVHVLDLAAVGALDAREGWAVDRVHPSPTGHAAIAAAAAAVLQQAGWNVAAAPALRVGRAPSRADRAWWCARHGAPYALTHVRDFGGSVLNAWR